ncbi:ExbD/TolR family protein [Haliangium sp.]|uniref:ExbD/TolR family protein n=1 Tax=Haliangium sp. TaxID=2663208 RepID=UPI003D0C96C4
MNVTPLVDVCLVLLIIFMVVTPMLARGKEVPLPKTRFHETHKDMAQPIVVLDEDKIVYFDKEALGSVEKLESEEFQSLKERIDKVLRSDETIPQRVLFKADKDVRYKEAYPVLMAIHDAGLTNIDLGTNELKDE